MSNINDKGWNFPTNNYGPISGINDAGIETFKGSPYGSLAKEICQNSLDAIYSNDKPVEVEFAKFYINNYDIPGYDKLKDSLNRCYEYWKCHQNVKKAVDYFEDAIKIINKEKICILRISDFNTTGLTGSDKSYENTPWQNLIKASGVSDKGNSAGGSFGIGKSASFSCSKIRTLFYSTLDINGLEATQGVARLASFLDENDAITQGAGYYGKIRENKPMPIQLVMDKSFERSEKSGTDIFIVGFSDSNNWFDEVIKSVLSDFLISVYENKLVVKIKNNCEERKVCIDKNTIQELIEKYKEDVKFAYNYYQVLIAETTKVEIEEDFEKLGKVEIKVLLGNNLHRKALIVRSNGMKIFDKANISSNIHFAAIIRLIGDEINSFFRNMENPQHNKWEPERHQSSKEATRIKAKLFRFIKDTVLDLGRNCTMEVIDAEGVGEYLSDDFLNINLENTEETILETTSDIKIEVVKQKSYLKGLNTYEDGIIENEKISFGSITEEFDFIDGTISLPSGGVSKRKGRVGAKRFVKEEEESKYLIRKHIGEIMPKIRLFRSNSEKSEYTLSITTKQDIDSGYIYISISGEQNNIEAKIKSAWYQNTEELLKCYGGKIFIKGIKSQEKNTLIFTLDYSDNCSMEVSIYEYSL